MEQQAAVPRTSATSPSTPTGDGSGASDGTVYTNCRHGFSIKIPPGWRSQEQSSEAMGVVAVFTPDVNVWDLEEQIHVMIVDCDAAQMSGISLDEFTRVSIQQLQHNLEAVSELKTTDTKIAGIPAKLVQYRANMPQVQKRMRTYQAWFLSNNKAYMLSYNDTVGKSLAEFEKRKAMAQTCFSTFKLIHKTLFRPPVTEMLMRTYVDTEHDFQCNCLLAWKKIESLKPPLVLGLEYSSFMVDPSEKEIVTLQQLVSVQVLPPAVTAEKYAKLVELQFRKAGIKAEYKQVKLGRVHDATQATHSDKATGTTTHQTWLIRNQKVYTITYSYACISVDDRPAQLLPFFLDSFDLLTPGKPAPDSHTFLYENLVWRFSMRIDPEQFEPGQPMPGSLLTIQKKNANANLTVTAQRAATSSVGQTLDEQVNGVLKQLRNTIPNFDLDSVSDATFAGHPAKQILYRGSADGLNIQFQQYFTSVNGTLFFVCYADEGAKFAKSLREARKMLDSFSLR